MDKLREKIAEILGEFYNFGPAANPTLAHPVVKAILALPEIRDALAAKTELDAIKLALVQSQCPPANA